MKRHLLFYLLFFVIFLLKNKPLLAQQEADFLNLQYRLLPINHQGNRQVIQDFDANIAFPFLLKDSLKLLGRVGYETYWIDSSISNIRSVHGISSQIISLHKLKNNRSLVLLLSMGVYSDFQDISKKDFRLSTGFRFRKQISNHFQLGYGLSYSRQFFGNQLIPFIDVDWQISDRLRLYGPFPIRPKMEYQLTSNMNLGGGLSGDASSYRLSEQNTNRFIQINQWMGNLQLEQKVGKYAKFKLEIGRTFRQFYKVFEDSDQKNWTIITRSIGERPAPINEIDQNSWVLSMGLSIGLR